MGRDEVLENRKPFTEVRRDRGLDDRARGLGHQTTHAGQLTHLLCRTTRTRVRHHEDVVEARDLRLVAVRVDVGVGRDSVEELLGDLLRGLRPDIDDLVVALAVGDQTFLVLILDLLDLLGRVRQEAFLVRRDAHVVDADRHTRAGRVPIAERPKSIGQQHRRLVTHAAVALVDQLAERLLVHYLIDVLEGHVIRHDLAHQNAAGGRLDHLAVHHHADRGVDVENAGVVRDDHLFLGGELHALALHAGALAGHVVGAEDDVLGRADDRAAGRRAEDVVRRHHQHAGLDLRLDRERHVYRHLIAVEVRVERGTNERVELDRLALDQHRLEGLHAEAVKRGGAVEEDRVLLDHLRQDVPHLGPLVLDHLARGLDGRDEALLLQLGVDEGLEQLQSHAVGKPALMKPEFGADDDHRSPGIVHALTEQILPEATGLALEHVGETLQRSLARARDDPTATTVVEERVHRFLQHPLLVPDDDLRRVQLLQPLQAVVPVDHTSVEVVQVRGREPATVERNQRPQIRRDHRHDLEDHELGVVDLGLAERVEHLESLRDLLALRLGGRLAHLLAEPRALAFDVELLEEPTDALGADADLERVPSVLLAQLDQALVSDQLTLLELRVLRVENDMGLEVEDLLEVTQRDLEDVADPGRQRLEEPDVGHRRSQRDVPHALAAHLRLDDLDAALLADDAPVLHALVLAAVALVVLDRTEDLRAKEAVPLRLEGSIVDGLGLLHLAEGPFPDFVRRRQADSKRIEGQRVLGLLEEVVEIAHCLSPLRWVRS